MALVILPEPAVQQTLNIDDLAVTLDGSSVLSHLYAYDAVGDNWDRLRIGAVAGSLLVSLAAGGGVVDTELPAAVAAADNMANPTAPFVLDANMLWDGATWDRWPGNSGDGALVNTELSPGVAAADAMANPTVPQVLAHLMVWNGATWDRALSSALGLLVNTELPAAAALADAAANPTTPTVGAGLLGFNGATWDRLRSDIANGLDVDVTRVSGTVTVDSELPAAALLADNAATPTAPAVGAFNMVYDGATWDFLRGNSVGGAFVQGNVAQGAVNSMNPMLVAGDDGGNARVPTLLTPADGAAHSFAVRTAGYNQLFNGTTYDRERNNHEITALASGARVATTTSATLTNYNAKGMTIQLDVTAVGAPAGTVLL